MNFEGHGPDLSAKTAPKRKVTSLEGMRSLAILAVLAYHLDVIWLPSGHLGVVMFLVLGGYLMASSLLRRLDEGDARAIPLFWANRLRRVWPSTAVLVVLVTFAAVIGNHVLLTKLRPDFWPSLLMCTNVASIARGASYFDNIGGPSPLGHLWYLGLDFQMALIMPLILFPLMGLHKSKPRTVALIFLVISQLSALEMLILYSPNVDPSRVYYGPDTRAFAPFIGAALALVWPVGKDPLIPQLQKGAPLRRALPIAGPVALVLIIAIMVLVDDTSPFLYEGGMDLVSLACAVLIASLLCDESPLSAGLGTKPFVWLGSRSFGIYLWHFPLIQFIGTQGSVTPLQGVLVIVLSVAFAELSFRFVELPLGKKGALSGAVVNGASALRTIIDARRARSQGNARSVHEGRSSHDANLREERARNRSYTRSSEPRRKSAAISRTVEVSAGVFAAAAVISLTAVIGWAVVPDKTLVPKEAIQSAGEGAATAEQLGSGNGESAVTIEEMVQDPDSIPVGAIAVHESDADREAGLMSPFMLGDSVPGGALDYFPVYFPDGHVDSYVGRTPGQMLDVLNSYIDQGVVGDVVILEAWSNNTVDDDFARSIIDACGERQVFIVNTHIANPVGKNINEQLARIAGEYDNVRLIDWSATADAFPEYLYDDDTHLTPEGAEPYIALIANSVSRTMVERGGYVTEQTDEPAAPSDPAEQPKDAQPQEASEGQ